MERQLWGSGVWCVYVCLVVFVFGEYVVCDCVCVCCCVILCLCLCAVGVQVSVSSSG